MKTSVFLVLCWFVTMISKPIFDFQPGVSLSRWLVVNDGVMGGRSKGQLKVDANGHGVFYGKVSLENNGGFSSLRFACNPTDLTDYRYLVLRLKGDGKRYQMRIKQSKKDFYSYVYYFNTKSQWEEIKIPLNSMYPVFRGNRLNLPDFNGDSLEEIGILIGNKKAEEFELTIDAILLE